MSNPIPYLVLDSQGECVNRVMWDGDASTWQPPADCNAVPDSDFLESVEQVDAPVRARDEQGRFLPDDPTTPENEAWA